MKKQQSLQFKNFLVPAIAVFLSLYALYNKALFNAAMTQYDKTIYLFVLLSSLSFLILAVVIRKSLKGLNVLPVALMSLVPLSYFVSYFFSASSYMASTGILISLLLFLLFVAGLIVSRVPGHIQRASEIVLSTGYIVVAFGILNWFGNASFWGLFSWTNASGQASTVFPDAVWMAADGPRLASVFQYSNTYGGFLLALILMSVHAMISSNSKIYRHIAAVMMVPLIVSFFLTLSRGALVLLPVMVIIVLFFYRPAKQVLYFLYLALASVISLVILNLVSKLGKSLQETFSSHDFTVGCLIVLGASIVCAGFFWLLNKFSPNLLKAIDNRLNGLRFSSLFFPFSLILLSLIAFYLLLYTNVSRILPESVSARIQNIDLGQQTVLERQSFFTDALRIFADHPVFGAGGGAWKALYPQYQSYPYISTQAHNFFLQYLLETGIFGLLFLLLLIVFIVVFYLQSFLRHRQAGTEPDNSLFYFFIFIICLLGHSFIDFDMSYVYVAGLVFFSLGILSSSVSKSLLDHKYNKWSSWLIGIASSLTVIFAGLQYLGYVNYQKSLSLAQQSVSFEQMISPLNKAVSISKNPTYLRYRLDFYQQGYQRSNNADYLQKAIETANLYKKYEPNDRNGYLLLNQFYQQNNMTTEAVAVMDEAIKKFPWDIGIYEQAIGLNARLGDQGANQSYWNKALDLYNRVQEKVKFLSNLPENQLKGQAFSVTKTIASTVSQIYFFQGQYQKSAELLKRFVGTNYSQTEDRIVMRFYLATLSKMNQPNDELYNNFTKALPEEAAEIARLVAKK
ncbi:hypothetical protein GE107_07465 [Cohnella sp. CFH 77786]|uniref:O-antigen ligase family protein n=1 Tax=Cohnella sp. CFH 77786 TaxID=2662265 RepID=UPI001C609FBC|nr:O-antigen ligase family protein [Cohnella sp. CFH 77786]MBW5445895.1 hypothetical protein [Cohnella sp. CFH 77786]